MAKATYDKELEQFREYLRSERNEDARRPLLYPLFQKLFKDKFRIESAAERADAYVEGKLIVESKTDHTQWLEGFYQALHYQRKYGLGYNTVMVVAREFVAIWKLKQLPEYAVIQYKTADVNQSPNAVGKANARKTSKANKELIKQAAYYWLDPRDLDGDIFQGAKNLLTESYEVLKILNNLDSDRIPVTTHNFIDAIELFKPYFEQPIDAVHCFYSIVAYWDITSVVTEKPNGTVCVTGFNGQRASDDITIGPRHIHDFRKLIEGRYIFTNEGSGLTVDYYFSRFDEVLARIDPEYVKQHGIFFTNDNLSKFALWYVKEHFPGRIDEDYIVFDPAGGSGNLVSSWRGKLKHKIISELQPDLLRIIERRMNVDPFHLQTGFTIVPKTSEGKGLNFLDRSATAYLEQLSKEVGVKGIKLDKPLAFLLNPPYKTTDEGEERRVATDASYEVHPSIIDLTGDDAGKERYLAFLAQILNIAREQARLFPGSKPMVMVFTPTSWLLPRTTYKPFRAVWDREFKYHGGFIVTSSEWFKLKGTWPLAFTLWAYDPVTDDRANDVQVLDLTGLHKADLNISWNAPESELRAAVQSILSGIPSVELNDHRGSIRQLLPLLERKGERIPQPRLNFYRNQAKEEVGLPVISGFPLKDERHSKVKAPYGFADGNFVGFMDDATPVRLRQEPSNRHSNLPDRVWFRQDLSFIDTNKSRCLNGAPDQKGYCAYDLPS
ncbi:MAG: hypothetical protein KF797_06355, partial [Flavobacteriales bacterium]|nr:hypothetical protein [Flavobacteriales bacterium]